MDKIDDNNISGTGNDIELKVNREFLETTSKWAGIVGIFTIVSGVLASLSGIGIIVGIINIILGLKLNKVKKSIEDYLRGDSNAINDTFENMGSYFKLQAILMIVALVLCILATVFFLGTMLFIMPMREVNMPAFY